MPIFLNDTFDEAAITGIESHTFNTGAAWTRVPLVAHGGLAVINVTGGTGVVANADVAGAVRNAAAPGTADYYVEIIYARASGNYGTNGVLARLSSNAADGYELLINTYGDKLLLRRINNYTRTEIGEFAYVANTAAHTYRLEVNGATIKGFIDGVQRISVVDAAPITAAGGAGFRIDNGAQFQSITAGTLTAAGNVIAAAAGSYAISGNAAGLVVATPTFSAALARMSNSTGAGSAARANAAFTGAIFFGASNLSQLAGKTGVAFSGATNASGDYSITGQTTSGVALVARHWGTGPDSRPIGSVEIVNFA